MRRIVLTAVALASSSACVAAPEFYVVGSLGFERFTNFGPVAASAHSKSLELDGLTFDQLRDESGPALGSDGARWPFGLALGARFNRYISAELSISEGTETDHHFYGTGHNAAGQTFNYNQHTYASIPISYGLLVNGQFPIANRWSVFGSVGAQRVETKLSLELCGVECTSSVSLSTGAVTWKGYQRWGFHATSTRPMVRAGIAYAVKTAPMEVRLAYIQLNSSPPAMPDMPSHITRRGASLQAVLTFNSPEH